MMPRKLLVVLALIVTAAALHAHEFWLMPDFAVRPGQLMKIVAHTGDRFPVGDSALELDHSARGKVDVTGIRVLEKSTEAEVVVKEAGNYVIAVEIKPRPIELAAGEFDDYLAPAGLISIIEMRANAKQENEPGKELYAKYAKSLVAVGSAKDDMATRALGLKLEIIPVKDPAQIRPGEKLPVRVLFDGRPLGNAQVSAVAGAFSQEGSPTYRSRHRATGW